MRIVSALPCCRPQSANNARVLSDNERAMNVQEFERLCTLGLGRAILHLRDHDARPYREIILDACLHNRAYDAQVEGSRAEYMLDVMQESGDLAFYADAVIAALGEDAGDWDDSHRFRIARFLAQKGSQPARVAMHSAFQKKRISATDIASEFIELDGIPGLLFVVGEIGEQLALDSDQWEDDFLLSLAGDICGPEKVGAALRNAADTDKRVGAYLSAVEENRALRARDKSPDPSGLTYREMCPLIGADGGILWRWGQTASDSDLKLAAAAFVEETDHKRMLTYLRLFAKRKYPLDLSHLFGLVALPDGPVPRHALRVLANLEDERIRRLAFNLVETSSPLRGYAVDLLVKNFHDSDHATVEAWCDAEQDLGTVNAFDRSLRYFFAEHPNSAIEVRLLRNLYEREPCAHCRCFIVERLLQLNGLTDTQRRECEHDSYLETRDLVCQQAG